MSGAAHNTRKRNLLKINNIICKGIVKHKLKNISLKSKTIQFYGNTLTLTKSNYTLYLTKDIRELIVNRNLHNHLKYRIECEYNGAIDGLDVEVTNIHHSGTLHHNASSLISSFLPELNAQFSIEEIEITQEQNIPSKTSLKAILQADNLNFLSLKLILAKHKATLKLQINKQKTKTTATLIISEFNEDTLNLVEFLDKQNGGTEHGSLSPN